MVSKKMTSKDNIYKKNGNFLRFPENGSAFTKKQKERSRRRGRGYDVIFVVHEGSHTHILRFLEICCNIPHSHFWNANDCLGNYSLYKYRRYHWSSPVCQILGCNNYNLVQALSGKRKKDGHNKEGIYQTKP